MSYKDGPFVKNATKIVEQISIFLNNVWEMDEENRLYLVKRKEISNTNHTLKYIC